MAIPFWKDIDARARDADVKGCIEMHPHNIVLNPGTMERLATEINATQVGAEMDPSHLFWRGIDPIEAIGYLGDLVYHAAAKDTRINEKCRRLACRERPVTVLRRRLSHPGQLQLTPDCDLAHQPASVRSKLYLGAG